MTWPLCSPHFHCGGLLAFCYVPVIRKKLTGHLTRGRICCRARGPVEGRAEAGRDIAGAVVGAVCLRTKQGEEDRLNFGGERVARAGLTGVEVETPPAG